MCLAAGLCLQPVLPSSGTAQWLIQLITPPDDTQGTSAQQVDTQPTAGVLVDTTKALNPGVKLFRYPDAKKPGRFKERPPNTNWSQVGSNGCCRMEVCWLGCCLPERAGCAGAVWHQASQSNLLALRVVEWQLANCQPQHFSRRLLHNLLVGPSNGLLV
jgi:hypothetical protein